MVVTSAEISRRSFVGHTDSGNAAVWGLVAMIVAFVGLFWPSWVWLAGEWSGSGGMMNHGYLVAALSVYLLINSLQRFAAGPVQPVWWMLPFVIGLSVVWLFAFVANVAAAHSFILPVILLATISAAFGFRAARTLSFAILYLYFSMPAWDQIQFVLQEITTFVVHMLVRLADISALVENNFVILPSGTFEIAEGCAGLRYILAALSFAALYGHIYYSTWTQKSVLAFVATLVAMFGNWIRVLIVVAIGDATDMQSPLVADHATFGWILFGVLMVPILPFARKLEGPEQNKPNRSNSMAFTNRTGLKLSWIAVVTSMGAMLFGPLWAKSVAAPKVDSGEIALHQPAPVPGWRGPLDTASAWEPFFQGAVAERMDQYDSEDTRVLVYSNIYLSQAQDRELIYFRNKIAGDWHVANDTDVGFSHADGQVAHFRQLRAEEFAGSWLIWYRYQINNRFVIEEGKGKIAQAIAVLTGKPEAGITAYAVQCNSSCDAAAHVLENFIVAADIGATINYTIEGS